MLIKKIVILCFSLFLFACGGAKVGTPSITTLSAALNIDSVSINVREKNSLGVVLTRIFDDGSQSAEDLVIRWEGDQLTLTDASDNVITLDYDKNLLKEGTTVIKFTDPASNISIEFNVEVILEAAEISVQEYVLAPANTELAINESIKLDITALLSDGSDGVVGNDVVCTLATINPVIKITEDCQVTALAAGEAVVTLNSAAGISDSMVKKANITVLPLPPAEFQVVKAELLLPENKLIEGQTVQLSVNLTYSNNEIVKDDFDLVKCLSTSTFIEVTSDCKVTSLSPGDASIQIISVLQSDAELLGLDLTIHAATIIQLSLSPKRIEIEEGAPKSIVVLADYDNGKTAVDVTSVVKCTITSGNDIVKITDGCNVSAIKSGSAEITATLLNGAGIETAVSSTITVFTPATSITRLLLSPSTLELKDGTAESIVVLADYNNGQTAVDVTNLVKCRVSSGNDVVRLVDGCNVSAIKSGSAEVTAELLDGSTAGTIVNANITVLPPHVVFVEFENHETTLIEGLDTSLTLLLTYSNGDTTFNEFNLVKCVSDSISIAVTDDCVITGKSPGTATIDLIMINGENLNLAATSIEILTRSLTELRVSPSQLFLQVGESQQFSVIADYNDGSSEDVTLDSTCMVNDSLILEISVPCNITALALGNAEVSAVLNNGADSSVASLGMVSVTDILVLSSGENLKLQPSFFGGSETTKITCLMDFDIVEPDCEVFAFLPGTYEVTATLRDKVSNEVINTVNRPVIVKAVTLGNLTDTSEFLIDVPVDTYDIVYEVNNVTFDEIYKVTLFDEFLPTHTTLQIFSDMSRIKTCRNTAPEVFENPRVACGIQASTEKLYISLSILDPTFGLSATIRIAPDVDILNYSGPLVPNIGSNAGYIDTYEFSPLTVGETYLTGHVPSNLNGNNVSRYFSSIDFGMDPEPNTGQFYTVSVVFDSANFDEQSVSIRWYNGLDSVAPEASDNTFKGEPGNQCIAKIVNFVTNTIACTFDNIGQSNIFVEINGNGDINSNLSNITAVEGEIGYSILLTQSQ